MSLFAGVGGFDLALERNGVKVIASVEIDKNARAVLAKQFPDSTILEDVQNVTGAQLIELGFDPTDGIIVGGFPCQDVSVAGRRAGLTRADGTHTRSGLFWEVVRILEETQAATFILENVPGLLSSNNGRDFAVILNALQECGYIDLSWRILDAQFFGVPQRRRRVFLVGCLNGSGKRAAEILAIEDGGRRFIETGGEERPRTAVGSPKRTANDLIHTFSKARRAQNVEDYETWVERDFTNTLNVFDNGGEVRATELIVSWNRVRRLMPIEMERLQGFPDGWTEGQADSNRTKQTGNAVAVPVVQWIINRMVGDN